MEIFNLENWQNIWGLIILVVLPIAYVLASFVYKKRKEKKKGVIPPQIMKYLLIPGLFIHLTLVKIEGFAIDSVLIKITSSLITMIAFSFLFNVLNYLFLSEKNILTRKEIIPKLGRDVIHIIFITFTLTLVFSKIWGLDLGNLLTALGVSSLVIGLALQEPLGNLFNGVSLLMANPFKKGDWISFGDHIGKVAEINWRSVKIHTRFNEQIIIPNNLLAKEKLKNLSRPNKIHAELLKFGFSYADSPEKVKQILLTIASGNDKVLSSPAPNVFTLSYDDFAIVYGIKFFLKDYEDIILINDEIMTSVYTVADENGLTIPFPRQDLEIKVVPKKDATLDI